jgi:ABC-2 type transport system permease protein
VLLIYLISGLVFYFVRNARAQFGAEEPATSTRSRLNQGLSGTALLVFIAALTIGAGSIASDNKANALLVYLSKPITRLDTGRQVGRYLPAHRGCRSCPRS